MVLDQLPEPGRPTYLGLVGQRPTAPVVGAGGACLDIFFFSIIFLLCLPPSVRWPDMD